MTDQEMALAIGRYIIKLQRQVSALEGAFLEYRINTPEGRREIPFREVAAKVAQEQGFLEVSSAQQYALHQAVEHETQSSALIRALHHQFLEET